MPLDELLHSRGFIIRLIIALVLLLIDVLWAFLRFPGGRINLSTMILFSYGPPTFFVIFWGMMVGYLLGAEPSAVLVIIWESIGIGVFLTIGVLQVAFMTVIQNTEHIIQLGVMVSLDFIVSILLIIDLILTNKDIIHTLELENSTPNGVNHNRK
nr:uncharacterized protein LOC106684691 isoform X2 [Halyomorpha halys]